MKKKKILRKFTYINSRIDLANRSAARHVQRIYTLEREVKVLEGKVAALEAYNDRLHKQGVRIAALENKLTDTEMRKVRQHRPIPRNPL